MSAEVVTRMDLQHAVAGAFAKTPATVPDLLAAATKSESHPDVLEIIRGLPPAARFVHLSQLWDYLPDMDIE
ncbi:hypothetical protein [Subtercola vilae]|uniref:DUF2795 domain-containing protein n=1 Tax=Subtercola vilae TaxID=2056433 RepID=A0A4T2BGP2_9MICO|nr:hypothetical protein [Subtercola vilae]TIH29492.1 hypothetical protein D4765_17920 [Subtercola vilae]